MEDLMDNTIENTPVIDNIGGFTTAQLFNGLQSDVINLQRCRARLLTQNTNNPTGVTSIFTFYGY